MVWEMVLAHARQFYRNRTTAFGGIVLPLVFLAVLVLSGYSSGGDNQRMRGMFAVAIYFMVASVCFFGTVSPVIALREKGVVSLLGTTPLPRGVFLAAMIPVRLVVGALLVAVALGVGHQLDILTRLNWSLLLAILAAVAFLLPLGLFMAAFVKSIEASNNVLSLILMLTTFMGGVLVPLTKLPEWLHQGLGYLPPSRVFDLLLHGFTGLPYEYSLSGTLFVIGLWSTLLAGLATTFFSWGEQE